MLKSFELMQKSKVKIADQQSSDVLEMIRMLLEMRTDTYLQCKCAMMAVSRGNQPTENFVNKLFSLTDKRRPLPIEMK